MIDDPTITSLILAMGNKYFKPLSDESNTNEVFFVLFFLVFLTIQILVSSVFLAFFHFLIH